MAKYIPDISTHRWVIVSPQRVTRPDDIEDHRHLCIFCPGHEKKTTSEVYRIGDGEADSPGWKVRVIPNKFPITDIHEVIIHSPDCERDMKDFTEEQMGLVFKAYRQRYNEYQKKGQVLIFCNHGEHAGASIDHPHSQLVVIPYQINLDTLLREPIQNLVLENKFFIIYCPDFSQWPYEVWIAPKIKNTLFGDITDEEIADLVELLKKMLKKLSHIYETADIFSKINKKNHPFGYNYYIYPRENWYLRLIPRFIHRAGFELGTGLSVNVIDPIDAAEELKK